MKRVCAVSSVAAAAMRPGVQCRNVDALARQHALVGDAQHEFDEERHEYTVFGQRVERSTTEVIAGWFAPFDPAACTDAYFARWAENPDSEYYEVIWDVRAEGLPDEEAVRRIHAEWERRGVEAGRLGTLLHLHCEYDCNGMEIVRHPELLAEIGQYECFKVSSFVRDRNLTAYRTELSVSYRVGEVYVCAGQIDALYVDAAGMYYIIDFKRVRAKYQIDPKHRYSMRGYEGAMGRGPVKCLPDTRFHKYSLQAAMYNVMLLQSRGIDAGARMYLLRMHRDRCAFELVQCADLRKEAGVVLAEEYARLSGRQHDALGTGRESPCEAGSAVPPRWRGA